MGSEEAAHEAVAEGVELGHRVLGRTSQEVSILGLGGGGLLMTTQDRDAAAEFVNSAIDLGINYLDTAPTYGPSEDHLGEVLEQRRDEVFLATKVHPRTRGDGWKTIEDSLNRLRTSVIDLIQVHDIETEEEVDQVLRPDGAVRAMLEAREQGLVRWIGITGHLDPAPMVRALARFDFDTVLIPVNVTDKHYHSYIDAVIPIALERNLGIIGMKVYCTGGVLDVLGVTPAEALRYALSFPVATAVVGADSVEQLRENAEAARAFKPMNEQEQQVMLDRTREKARECSGKFKREPG